jgi:hypothetical protein
MKLKNNYAKGFLKKLLIETTAFVILTGAAILISLI